MKHTISKIIIGAISIIITGTALGIISTSTNGNTNPTRTNNATELAPQSEKLPLCDGTTVTHDCQDDTGIAYQTYLQHEAVPEVTKEVTHPATPAVTRTVQHPAVTGTRQVRGDCIRTTISYKHGTCALSQCRDGSYSGSAGRGTCSYHGGVARSGGPWYNYVTETYTITPAWAETVEITPAKPAWAETVVVTPAQPAYLEKVPM